MKQQVRAENRTLSEFVLAALERELARSAFHQQLARRPRTDLGISAASWLEEARRERSERLS
ncbi:MAG: toxin-antitoxin system HicB family antitoxin [Acidobacteriota bacterium]